MLRMRISDCWRRFCRTWDLPSSYRDTQRDDLGDPTIAAADLLIVLGGPFGAYETETYPFLAREIGILERRLALGRPTLGICLGAQLMAKALGARVFPGPVKEVGWGRIDLTAEGRASALKPLSDDGAVVLHWHGDTFDLPDGATRLAANANYQNQAFSYDDRALALQFHLEADGAVLEKWYSGNAGDLEAVQMPARRVAGADDEDLAGGAGARREDLCRLAAADQRGLMFRVEAPLR